VPHDLDLPEVHAAFLATALERLQADARLLGVAAGGSVLTRSADEYSDLDLVIAVEPASFQAVLEEGQRIAADLGPLLAAFTGEHVAEPRLLICLYGPPLLHVDLKFVALPDLAERVEDPLVLWERDGRVSAALSRGTAAYPQPDLQWIEDRFWTWVHYTTVKIGRGELFEALDALAFLRNGVLGPLALQAKGARPQGLRRIEFLAPDFAAEMRRTIGGYDARLCAEALQAAADLYRRLRTQLAPAGLAVRAAAEEAALEHLAEVTARCDQPRRS
jgi:hypothetical protein